MTVKNLIDTAKFIDDTIIFNNDHKSFSLPSIPEAIRFYGNKEVEKFWVVDNQPHKDPRFTTLCIVIK